MLAKKSHDLLVYISDYIREHGYAPTFREMQRAIRVFGMSGMMELLEELECNEFIARGGKKRDITVLNVPKRGPCPHCGALMEKAA